MNTKKAGAIVVAALMVGTEVVPSHEQKHIEPRQYEEESTLTKPILLSTHSGTTPTLGTWIPFE